jgi:DnaJ family protein C protein 1
MKLWTPWLLVVFLLLEAVHCWDNEELEIFDLVEEVNTNFYTLLGVPEVSGFTYLSECAGRTAFII